MVISKNQRTGSEMQYRGSQKKISNSLLYKQCFCAGSLINTTGSVMKSANSLVPKFSKDLNQVVINKSKYPPNTSALCHHQHGGVELTQG